MRTPRKILLSLLTFFFFFATFKPALAIPYKNLNKLAKTNNFLLHSIDITPKEEVEKIKGTKRYPLSYQDAIDLLEINLTQNQTPSSLFHYTYLSEESKGDDELSIEETLKIMIEYLKMSTIKLNQKELDGQAWPNLSSKTHLLFVLNYDMDGFLALVKFTIDRKHGIVSLEEIAD